MIEFTILLDDSDLEFSPLHSNPGLDFILPPTARIGWSHKDRDVIHLAPLPVHCFFNGFTFGNWLSQEHGLSQADGFAVYMVHDLFKSLLNLEATGGHRRRWPHAFESFDHLSNDFAHLRLDDSRLVFKVARDHHARKVSWREAVEHERQLDAGTEAPGKRYSWEWDVIALTMRLQPALSNVLAMDYVKQLFIEAYIEALRTEYPDVFARYDAVSYRYEFVDPAVLSGNIEKDVETLAKRSKIFEDQKQLVIQSFIGASGPHWQPNTETSIKLPFWLLLTLHADPTSIMFPVPASTDAKGEPTANPAFVKRVKNSFYAQVRVLLESVRVSKRKAEKWTHQIEDIMNSLDHVFHISQTSDFTDVLDAREPDSSNRTITCSMCGSTIPESFACSPKRDLGSSVSNYTDWHIGDADQACVMCAIANFKIPDAIKPARKLIFQRKLIYFATSTPSARVANLQAADWPLMQAPNFQPRLEVRSLESLVTLNVIAALYLHNLAHQTITHYKGERDLWLEESFPLSPFSFIGEIGKRRNKVQLPTFLQNLFESTQRSVTLLDPLLPLEVEIPFHTLICLWGTSKGRHYELKYKPLIVSNESGTLPVVWEGYHFLDRQALSALMEVNRFVKAFGSRDVTPRMRVTAVATGPDTFIDTMVSLGGFGYETVMKRLSTLAGGSDPVQYLYKVQSMIQRTPILMEIWG